MKDTWEGIDKTTAISSSLDQWVQEAERLKGCKLIDPFLPQTFTLSALSQENVSSGSDTRISNARKPFPDPRKRSEDSNYREENKIKRRSRERETAPRDYKSRDDTRKDNNKRDEYRKDDNRRDEAKRIDIRRDGESRFDDQTRDDPRKFESRRYEDLRLDDLRRDEVRRGDSRRNDDSYNDEFRRDEGKRIENRKDDESRIESQRGDEGKRFESRRGEDSREREVDYRRERFREDDRNTGSRYTERADRYGDRGKYTERDKSGRENDRRITENIKREHSFNPSKNSYSYKP